MPENPYKSPEEEKGSARLIVVIALAAVLLFLTFQFVDRQFGDRAHTYTVVVTMVVVMAVSIWLNRRQPPAPH